MIENYLKRIDDLIITTDEIIDIEIIRRTIWNTELEKIGLYRYRIYFYDGSLAEITERLVEEGERLKVTKYRFHWQDKEGILIKRWDNARHHPEIETFPDHIHEGSEENVAHHEEISGFDVLSKIVKEISKKAGDL